MCKCTPHKRTPFCGAPGCEMPASATPPPSPQTLEQNSLMQFYCPDVELTDDERGYLDMACQRVAVELVGKMSSKELHATILEAVLLAIDSPTLLISETVASLHQSTTGNGPGRGYTESVRQIFTALILARRGLGSVASGQLKTTANAGRRSQKQLPSMPLPSS